MYKDKLISELKTIIDTYKEFHISNLNKSAENTEMIRLIDEIIKEKVITNFKSRFETLTLTNLIQVKALLEGISPTIEQDTLNLIVAAERKAENNKSKAKSKSNKPI